MIICKTPHEIDEMRPACKISRQALDTAGKVLEAGMTTAELDHEIEKFIRSQGAKPSFLGYGGFPASSCISINDVVIHGIPGKRKIQNGDIVSVDVGAYYNGYHGDNAETFIVGEVSDEARLLVEATKESLHRAISIVRPGVRLGDIGFAVQSWVEQYGFSVVTDFVGHGVGHDMHEAPDVPNYGKQGHGLRLCEGMTIAIEPMVNIKGSGVRVMPDKWTTVTKSGCLSAHFENTVAVTADGVEILTRS